MKIYSINNISFTSKKPEIRKADDIQRRAKLEFPSLSSSYVNDFYISTGRNSRITKRRTNLYEHLRSLIEKVRKYPVNKLTPRKEYVPYIENLNGVKKYKAGNCMESAMAAMSALYANGYKNTKLGSLVYKADFLDKKTGEVLFSDSISLDHSFAVTDMNSGKNRNIVVDPWLGFADTKGGAISRYKGLRDERYLNNAISILAKPLYSGYKMHIDDIKEEYNIRAKIEIQEEDFLSKQDIENIATQTKIHFPNLIL